MATLNLRNKKIKKKQFVKFWTTEICCRCQSV